MSQKRSPLRLHHDQAQALFTKVRAIAAYLHVLEKADVSLTDADEERLREKVGALLDQFFQFLRLPPNDDVLARISQLRTRAGLGLVLLGDESYQSATEAVFRLSWRLWRSTSSKHFDDAEVRAMMAPSLDIERYQVYQEEHATEVWVMVARRLLEVSLSHLEAELDREQLLLPDTRTRITVEEANDRAKKLARASRSFVHKTLPEWAAAIGCSTGLIPSLPLWKATMRASGRGKKGKRLPKATSFTANREALAGEGKKNEVLNQLIAEQDSDAEPSPLENDPPGTRPRTTLCRKRL